MPQLDYSTFARGGAQYPLTSSTASSFLQDADPSLYQALAYFQGVCGLHFGERLVAEASACGASITAAVAATVPFDPTPYLTQAQFTFPLLAISRTKAKYPRRTVAKPHSENEWNLLYILPPLTAAQMERIAPVLKAVADVLDDRIVNGFDPNLVAASGAAASITYAAGVNTVTGLSGIAAGMVGAKITLSGAHTTANNGAFFIASVPSSSSVTVANTSGATDSNNGHITWSVGGVHVWQLANLEEVTLEDSTTGRLQALAGDIFFPCYSARITCKEITVPVSGAFQAMQGIDVALPVYDSATETSIDGIVDFKTDVTIPGPG